MSFIPCVAWSPRGAAKGIPDRVRLTTDELAVVIQAAKIDLDAVKDDEESSSESELQEDISNAIASNSPYDEVTANGSDKEEDSDEDEEQAEASDLAEYNMEDYDNEAVTGSGLGLAGLTVFAANNDDPYITKKEEENDSDEEDDINIKPSDNMIVVGRAHKEYSNLDVYIFNEEKSDLYVHHDILLSSYPLCAEWLNFDPDEERAGNLVAIGNLTPIIEVWDLDMLDTVEPAFTLGQKAAKKKAKKDNSHSDAVLDISWNRLARNVLASGSADFTVGLWDMSRGALVDAITHHTEKVQTLQWHPFEAQTLLSGSFDNTAKMYDCRRTELCRSWQLDGEIERVVWNHFSPYQFLASNDSGAVYCLDARKDAPVYTLKAHTAAVTGLAISHHIPGCLVTTSSDHKLKVWDIQADKPEYVSERKYKVGAIHCLSASPDSGFVFAFGGDKDEVKVLDIREAKDVTSHFGNRQPVLWKSESPSASNEAKQDIGMDVESSFTDLHLEPEPPGKHSGAKPKKKKAKSKKKIKSK